MILLAAVGCDPTGSPMHGAADLAGGGGAGGGSGGGGGGGMQTGCEGQGAGCYTVYAHSNDTLYAVDLMAKSLKTVGNFNAPGGDVITDLAVAPDDTIYVVSKTKLYTASPTDGHVTVVGTITACGMDNVAMTTTPDGKLFVADFKGAFCRIDTTTNPPMVMQLGMLGQGLALSGDLVGVSDGTVYGTAYKLADPASGGSNLNNLLVKLDTTSGAVTATMGATGFPKLFGASFALGKVFGFTHDGSGEVITIDPKSGAGTLYATFKDGANKGIAFAGAGVNSMVPGPIQ